MYWSLGLLYTAKHVAKFLAAPAPLHCIISLITGPRGRGYWTALVDCSTYTATSTRAEKSAEAFPDPKLQAKNVP